MKLVCCCQQLKAEQSTITDGKCEWKNFIFKKLFVDILLVLPGGAYEKVAKQTSIISTASWNCFDVSWNVSDFFPFHLRSLPLPLLQGATKKGDPLAWVTTKNQKQSSLFRPISLHYLDQREAAKGDNQNRDHFAAFHASLSFKSIVACSWKSGGEIIKLDKQRSWFMKNDNFRFFSLFMRKFI